MFYIDFTASDGHSYRVDLSETPITHLCPVCGNIEYFKLDDSDHYYWCDDCRERREEQERMENYIRPTESAALS
jgi:hypothetical protein